MTDQIQPKIFNEREACSLAGATVLLCDGREAALGTMIAWGLYSVVYRCDDGGPGQELTHCRARQQPGGHLPEAIAEVLLWADRPNWIGGDVEPYPGADVIVCSKYYKTIIRQEWTGEYTMPAAHRWILFEDAPAWIQRDLGGA